MFSVKSLECQGCGKVIKILTEYENQQVADNPYNFVGYCESCWKVYNFGTWKWEND